jgi:ribonucleoside-diphosphate reductase alpha chain
LSAAFYRLLFSLLAGPNILIVGTAMHTNTSLAVATPNSDYSSYQVIRRNGQLTGFDGSKIQVAVTKAFLAVEGGNAAGSHRIRDIATQLTQEVCEALFRRQPNGGTVHIEDIQDQVELALMRNGHHKTARAYVLYREEHARQRQGSETHTEEDHQAIRITLNDGTQQPLNQAQLKNTIEQACAGLSDVNAELILKNALRNLFDGIAEKDVSTALVMSARMLIEHEPNYSYVAARLLLDSLRREALRAIYQGSVAHVDQQGMAQQYGEYFADYIKVAVELELLDPELLKFDLQHLGDAIKSERDMQFTYLGLQTLYDRYFVHSDNQRLELPQAFFMRVAMGLAINEVDREARAIEFYTLLSSFDFMSSTPTLFNSGTLRPQLSSCYLTTVPDNLDGIYSAIKDNALLSKFAGGLGNDWTPVRGLGAHIKGTNGKSQGVVPFLKVANDTAVAVNQGGKRKGAVCAYLETWHIDIEEFLELRKNTGDERRRTHDMNSANWIPDLFMERVADEAQWTLFSPDETPELHELTGQAFREKYEEYESRADRGELTIFKRVSAVNLWRKMLSQLFETGHPWITFKDPCNIRYTNQHMGVVHSSNLCTEITLHTSEREIAVCNLGSVNIAAHVDDNGLDLAKLERTINAAMRILDNVIEYNYYAVAKARNANLHHRPVGLGLIGFQDTLYQLDTPYASAKAVAFADASMEAIAYYAILASTNLAEERGRYSTFEGSLWSQGVLPYDSLNKLKQERGRFVDVDDTATLDWGSLRERVQKVGMRNSNCMAIAPTATISNICGVSQSIEPTYQNLFVKSNLSGEFTVVNPHLVRDLKARGLWDDVMVNDLKYFDGSVQQIERIPEAIKQKYATAFEIDSRWLIEAASRRQKWLDQAQSLNLYLAEPDGKALDSLYKLAWVRGLKTTYYLRTLGATHVEKSDARLVADEAATVCSIDNPDCEACQ